MQRKVCLGPKEGFGKPSLGHQEREFIGCYDDSYLYLLPSATWNIVKRFCLAEDSHFPVSQNTLYKMLANRGVIVKGKDGRNTVNERIKGAQKKVLKLSRQCIGNIETDENEKE
jgi:hypothetical protein